MLNTVPILISQGVSPTQAATIAGTSGIAGIAGRFAGGWAMDRWNAKWLVAGASVASLILPLTLLINPNSNIVAIFGVSVYAGTAGMKYPGIVYLVSRHFGPRSFGTLFGAASIGSAAAAGVGPMLVNYIYDVTHSYVPALWAAIPMLMIAGFLFASLGRYPSFEPSTDTPNAPERAPARESN